MAVEPLDTEKLAHTISHDVRAPLRAVESFAAFLVEDAGVLTPAATEDLSRLRAAAARLRRRLDAVVDYLRAGEVVPGAKTSVKDVFGRLFGSFGPRFVERQGALSIAEGDSEVAVAAHLLEGQLGRLVENVLAHHPGAPHAWLSVIALDGKARIEVADDGPGLEAAIRERAFELFGAARPRSDGEERAAAGLAIVARAAHAWGGEISLHERAGGGLVVRLELPRPA
jgi:signal transduction histidine kinase